MTPQTLTTSAPGPWRNVAELLVQQAALSPQAIALITPEGEWTYRDLEQAVARYAHGLTHQGVRAGDRLAFIMSDERIMLTAMLAAARIAAPVMLIPRSSSPSQRNLWMGAAGIRCVVSDTDPGGWTSTHPWPWIDARRLAASPMPTTAPEVPAAPSDPNDSLFIVVVGSGTTGRQKLIPITHTQMLSRAHKLCSSLGVTAQDRLATLSHFEYVGGIHRLVCALLKGAGFVLLGQAHHEWRQWPQRFGLTILSATVFHTEQMLKALQESGHSHTRPLDSIQLSLSSSVVTQALRQRILSELCSNLRVNYGTNESWSVSVAQPSDLLKYPGTVGRPLPGVTVQIVDEQLKPLALGQTGLIAIRTDQLIAGYLDDEEATQKAFREGWFIPGDLGHFTDNGQLIFCGRSDNLMIFNGINIYPIEIEQCLLSHPDVADALAMPTRHAIHQDVPVALVVLKENATSTEQDLMAYAAAALGAKQPRRVVLTPTIPRNPVGKPLKTEVMQMLSPALSHTAPQSPAQHGPWMKISFKPKPKTDSHQLNLWRRVLGHEETPLGSDAFTVEPQLDEAQAWFQAILDLALALLQSARIPVFDAIAVVQCQPEPDKPPHWLGVCQQPDPRLVPAPTVLALFREVVDLAEWACKADVGSNSQRQDFFRRIETGAFRALASLMPKGKSAYEVLRVAHQLSIPYQALPGGVFQLGWGRRARLIHRSTTDHDSAIGLHLTADKFMTAQLLRQAGLPAPLHHRASTLAQAQTWAQRIGYPVVVKPPDMERGEGVAVDVTEGDLEEAFQIAQQKSPSHTVLIERQVPGVCHRLFISQGQLLYAVKRLPMGVYGDGTSSISELVQAAHHTQMQRPPWMRSGVSSLLTLPLDTLRQQGWTPEDRPPPGHFVALRRIESTAWGGIDEDVTPTVHPDNVSVAIRATELLGLEVAGVDMISPDITQAWHHNGAVINEVNYAPLLGGGEISRKLIPTHLSRLLKDQGRIPIETVSAGGDAWARGLAQHQRLQEAGFSVYLTDEKQTLDPQGHAYPMASNNLRDRVQALLMNKQVGALVIVNAPNKTPRP